LTPVLHPGPDHRAGFPASVDVPATLASRARLLSTGHSNKNDPNDARSVAIAALRSRGLRRVEAVGHSEVLRLLAKRNTDIGNHRTRLVCRMHALLVRRRRGRDLHRILPRRSRRPTTVNRAPVDQRRPCEPRVAPRGLRTNRDGRIRVSPTHGLGTVAVAVVDELVPAVFHNTAQYANNRIEADHGGLKSRLRPMRGLKRDHTARVIMRGHAFM
jgi:hypothetical protein